MKPQVTGGNARTWGFVDARRESTVSELVRDENGYSVRETGEIIPGMAAQGQGITCYGKAGDLAPDAPERLQFAGLA